MSAIFYLLQSWQSKTNKIFFFSLYSMFINLACYIQQSSNKWSTKRNLQSDFENFFRTLFLGFHGICKSILVFTLNIKNIRLLSKHFCLQPFFPKDSVSLLFAYFKCPTGWPHGKHRGKNF